MAAPGRSAFPVAIGASARPSERCRPRRRTIRPPLGGNTSLGRVAASRGLRVQAEGRQEEDQQGDEHGPIARRNGDEQDDDGFDRPIGHERRIDQRVGPAALPLRERDGEREAGGQAGNAPHRVPSPGTALDREIERTGQEDQSGPVDRSSGSRSPLADEARHGERDQRAGQEAREEDRAPSDPAGEHAAEGRTERHRDARQAPAEGVVGLARR